MTIKASSLPPDYARCHGIVGYEQKCDRIQTCLRHRVMETDRTDQHYSYSLALCYIDQGHPYYFYYIPTDE